MRRLSVLVLSLVINGLDVTTIHDNIDTRNADYWMVYDKNAKSENMRVMRE